MQAGRISLSTLRCATRAVQLAERKFVSAHEAEEEWQSFLPQGKRGPLYAATPPSLLLRSFQRLHLSADLPLADLGSGLGMSCFTGANRFYDVTGFELDARLHQESERIRADLGIKNVTFRNEDFIEADLSRFRAVFFFRPFTACFREIMGEKLRCLIPGTVVIPEVFTGDFLSLFPPDHFQPFNHSTQNQSETNSITAFVKI